jgi:hypothetical protein
MRKLKLLGLILLACCFNFSSKAQKIDSVLTNLYEKSSFEKVYIQFDNNRYAPGQNIWYKAYLTSGAEPSLVSKNLYIDWYDDQGKLINSTVNPIIEGYSSGNYTVPEQLKTSSLQAVAYTKWMRNFDSSYFFQKRFPILTKSSKPSVYSNKPQETIVQFLPESGNILLNKQNVIAFKAVNQFGLPTPINGVIKNQKGDTITSYTTIHDGMGKFQFTPISNEQYIAEWADNGGTKHQSELPRIFEEGINLMVEAGKSNRTIYVQRTATVPESMKKISVIAQMNGVVLFKASANLTNKESVSSSLPISNFESGILQVTVFDANNQPLCERLLFVKNEDYLLSTALRIDTLNTNKRGKNVLELELKDTTLASLSIAITDADLNDAPDISIASQLLLKGDLTGNIFKPAYYFSSNEDSISNHLDLVMLTNGWRRFSWKKILNNQLASFPYAKDSTYLTLKGQVDRITETKITKAGLMNLILVNKDSSKAMLFLPIQNNGNFSEKEFVFFDTAKIFYKLNGMRLPSKTKVSISNDFFRIDSKQIISKIPAYEDTVGLGKYNWLALEQIRVDSLKKLASLKEVIVYASRQSRINALDKKYASGMFTGDAQYVYDLTTEDHINNISVMDFLNGKVGGLQFRSNRYSFPITTRQSFNTPRMPGTNLMGNHENPTGGQPSYYLNEFMTPPENIENINVSDLAYIKIFTGGFFGGNSSRTIAIYTRKGSDIKYNGRGMDYTMVSGYSPIREFYSPSYAETEQEYITPDLRATILWNPWINLDKNNQKAKISFYNNDITHRFRVIIEGMDSEGKLIHINKLIQSK